MPSFRTLQEGGEKLKGLLSDAFSAPKKKKKKPGRKHSDTALLAYSKKLGKEQSEKARADAKLVKSGKLSKKEWQKRHMKTSKKPTTTKTEKVVGKAVAKAKKAVGALDYDKDDRTKRKNGYS